MTNSICTPRCVSVCTIRRKSSRLRARRSMLCTTTVSPVRAKLISASSCGRLTSLPDALSLKARSTLTPSSCRSGFWSKVLTLIYPMRCPVMEFPAKCQGRLYDLQRDMSINSKFNPILTQFTHGI
ncbi:Uncharacterised protein [Acinetobacter baumannii]|nr:Uncharacterised protein [Acinetobacter baumannii]SSW43681.1 Uncharacterised protein [Acinetobacter baumannii]